MAKAKRLIHTDLATMDNKFRSQTMSSQQYNENAKLRIRHVERDFKLFPLLMECLESLAFKPLPNGQSV